MSRERSPRARRRRKFEPVAESGIQWTPRRLALTIVPFVLLAVIYVVATVDIRAHDGRALRNVDLGMTSVSGLTPAELEVEFDRLGALLAESPVTIFETPEYGYYIEAERLGLTIDRPATLSAVLESGRQGSALMRPFVWLGSVFSPHRVDAVVRLDPVAAEAGLAAVSKQIGVEPGAPILEMSNGRLELVAGAPGRILDVERLTRDLGSSLPEMPGDTINVQAFTVQDASIDREIQGLVDRLNGFTSQAIEFRTENDVITVGPAELRSWVDLVLDAEPVSARFNSERMYASLSDHFRIGQEEIDTRALLVTGSQVRLPAENARTCCDPETATKALEEILLGRTWVTVNLITDDLTPLAELGIAELVGEFTTEHPPGEDRVLNIQRMADIVRGALIAPDATFSLNGYVGERTTAAGFVPAGVIYDGEFTEDVGGGVSQFATTLFNAAFFAGLDINQYQAHTIYIDRYPYGREATVNWPSVDLKISNPTGYPVLVWTEYTERSITVKLFGTATVSGEQTDQTTESLDECTRVRTERTRVWADGRSVVDTFGAVYQPAEGIGCDGQPTVPIPECGDGELLIDTGEDGFGDSCAPPDEVCAPDTSPVDEDGDGLFDFCASRECPPDSTPTDSDGDGEIDLCLVEEPTVEPTPEPTLEALPTPTSQSDEPSDDGDTSGETG